MRQGDLGLWPEPREPSPQAMTSGWMARLCQAGTLLYFDKYTAEENSGISPKEKALLLSHEAALTPEECRIGNESWTENQFQQETG